MLDEKVVVIHQPDFMPYLGFFHRLLYTDLFVILDDVQFLPGSKSWHNRDKIKTPYGEKWMTVSVQKGHSKRKINEVKLSTANDWKSKNLNQIISNYRTAKYFNEILPFIREVYEKNCEYLSEFNYETIKMLMKLFNIEVKIVFNGSLHTEGRKNELIVNIVKYVGGTTYLSGVGAKAYFEPEPYEESGIKVIWQNFKHPVYSQLYGEFIPFLSSIDLLFNCGIEESRRILREEC